MEMTLHFTDDDQFEVDKFKRAITADEAYYALSDILNLFRNICKHNPRQLSEEQINLIDSIWDEVMEIVNDNVDMNLYG